MGKEIRCNCGKLLAKLTDCGKIVVWCKGCHKEVPLEWYEETSKQEKKDI